MKRILGRLTYANVMATLALFVALGLATVDNTIASHRRAIDE